MAETSSSKSKAPAAANGGLRTELIAGITLSVIALPSSMAAGVVAYQALGPDMAAAGSIAGLAGAVFAGLAAALTRTPSPVPTTPGVMVALLNANFAAATLVATGDLNLTLAAMAVSVALAGIWQILFGFAGLGNVVRYVPHPVLAGFGLGVSVLVFIGQFPLLFGRPTTLALVTAPPGMSELAMPLIGIALVAGMLVLAQRFPRLPVPLVGLLIAIVVYHSATALFPGIALGRTASGDAASSLMAIVTAVLQNVPLLSAALVPSIVINSIALAAIGIFDTLLTVRASKAYIEIEATPCRELAGLGVGNLVASVSGATAMTTSLAVAVPAYLAGGRTTLTRIVGCFALLAIALIPGVVGSMPLLGLTALTIFFVIRSINWAVFDMVRDALWPKHPGLRGRSIRDLSIFVAVMLGIVVIHPTMGVLIGVVLSALMFITDMARPVVVARSTGATLLSRRARSAKDMEFLRQVGGRTMVLRLQGVLFFGNCDDLNTELRRREDEFDTVILDMKRITDIDLTGKAQLQAMGARLAKLGKHMAISGLSPDLMLFLGEQRFRTDVDLDAALEFFEEQHLGHREDDSLPLADLEFLKTLAAERIAVFSEGIDLRDYGAGEFLCRYGEPGDGMWIILFGSVSIRVPSTTGITRVAGIAAGAPAGELAMLEQVPRSADIVADGPLKTAYLTRGAFHRLATVAPDVSQALLAWIALVTAQRLRATSETLAFMTAD